MNRLEREIAAEEAYISRHCLPQMMEYLTFAILMHRPADHAAFTKTWLLNLHARMRSLGQSTVAGIDLSSISGIKLEISANNQHKRDERGEEEGEHEGAAAVASSSSPRVSVEDGTTTISESSRLSFSELNPTTSIRQQPMTLLGVPQEGLLAFSVRDVNATTPSVGAASTKLPHSLSSTQLPPPASTTNAQAPPSSWLAVSPPSMNDLNSRSCSFQSMVSIAFPTADHLRQLVDQLSSSEDITEVTRFVESVLARRPRHLMIDVKSAEEAAHEPQEGSSTANARRVGVSAMPIEAPRVEGTFVVSEVEKTVEEAAAVRECVRQTTLFSALDVDEQELVVKAMEKVQFAAGTTILEQGAPGRDTFYLIAEGTVEIIRDRKIVATLTTGQYFGELELMYITTECAATVKAVTPVSTYALGKAIYSHIVLNSALTRRNQFVDLVRNISLFKTLSDYDHMVLAEALSLQRFQSGDFLIRCEEPVQWMHVVMEGTVKVVGRQDHKKVDVVELGPGSVVGELEFVFGHHAVADVIATTKVVKTAKLNRQHFYMVMQDDVVDQFKKNIAKDPLYANYFSRAAAEVRMEIEAAAKRHSSLSQASRALSKTTMRSFIKEAAIDVEGEILLAPPGNQRNLWRFALSPAVNAHGMLIIFLQEDGTVLQLNERAQQILRYQPDELVGQSIFSLFKSSQQQSAFLGIMRTVRKYAGNWKGYEHIREKNTPLPIFQLTSGSGLFSVSIALTVVPPTTTSKKVANVFMLWGHEAKRKGNANPLSVSSWVAASFSPHIGVLSQLVKDLPTGQIGSQRKMRAEIRALTQNINKMVDTERAFDEVDLQAVHLGTIMQQFYSAASPAVIARQNRLIVEATSNSSGEFSSCNDATSAASGRHSGGEVSETTAFLDVLKLFDALVGLVTSFSDRGTNMIIRVQVSLWQDATTRAAESINLQSNTKSADLLMAGTMRSSPSAIVEEMLMPTHIRFTVQPSILPQLGSTSESSNETEASMRSVASDDNSTTPRNRALSVAFVIGARLTSYFPPEVELPMHVLEVPYVPAHDQLDGTGGGAASSPGGGAMQAAASKDGAFTTVLVEPSSVQRNHFCQALWARKHAVLPVTTLSEVSKLLVAGKCDILLIDPVTCTDDADDSFLKQIFVHANKIAVIFTSEDGSIDMTASDGSAARFISLTKPCSLSSIHQAVERAERIVLRVREEEEKINLLRNTFNTTKRGQYKQGRLLGRGAFGEVYEVEDELTGGKMAMKILRIKGGPEEADAIVDEIRTMTSLSHRNIIQYLYCEKVGDFELKIFMEAALGGTLQDKIKRCCKQATAGAANSASDAAATSAGGLPHEEIVSHLRDLLCGLEYLHSNGFVHGDIKTANALLGAKDQTKLGDFGTAKKLKEGEKLYVMCGTPAYMAPEVMAADPVELHGYDMKADIWSLGCVALEMATGQLPFAYIEGTQGMGIIKFVSELTQTPDLSPLFQCSPLLFELVKACFELDPSLRPTATQLLKFNLFYESSTASNPQAEKVVKRAQLVHALNKFAAFSEAGPNGRLSVDEGGGGANGSQDDVRRFSVMVKKNFFDDSEGEDEDEEIERPG